MYHRFKISLKFFNDLKFLFVVIRLTLHTDSKLFFCAFLTIDKAKTINKVGRLSNFSYVNCSRCTLHWLNSENLFGSFAYVQNKKLMKTKRRKSRLQLLESWTLIRLQYVKNIVFLLLYQHQLMQILEQLMFKMYNETNTFFFN